MRQLHSQSLRSPLPGVGKRELWEQRGSNHFEIIKFCPSSFTVQSASMEHGPEIVAPRAFIFRPLVKGNKDYGNETGNKTSGTR